MPRAVLSYTCFWVDSQLYTMSKVKALGGSPAAPLGSRTRTCPPGSISTTRTRPAPRSVPFIGRHRTTTFTDSAPMAAPPPDARSFARSFTR